jgi:alkylation response protein AidB-like acyl-CoA dehydrogenase
MAKYWVTDLQGEVVDECLQLHGGYGYMNEYPIAQHVPRRPRPAHLRRHQRDHEAADRPHPGGTAQHTLLTRRIAAFEIAIELLRERLGE